MKVIIDLEATCEKKEALEHSDFNEAQSEIIEIGACLIDLNCNVLSEFQVFVRPVLQPILTDFCTELTHISQDDVDAGTSYSEAIAHLDAWFIECEAIHGEITEWGSWGGYDKRQFMRNSILLNCHEGNFMKKAYVNLKELYASQHKDIIKKKRAPGVGLALRQQRLTFEGTAHRALDDAKNIARLAPYAFGIKKSRLVAEQII